VTDAHDFWLSCGHHLLDRSAGGGLLVTDDFLKAYLARPELLPPAGACEAERTLHAKLLRNPRELISAGEIGAIVDTDARENWTVMVALRDQLTQHRTLEAAYLDIVRRNLKFPHLLLNQIVHVILRNALHGSDDAFVLRAGELYFRSQKLTVHEGALIAADEETVAGTTNRPVSPLVSMLGIPAAAEIDILNEDNAANYWERSDLYDMALDLTAGRRGIDALGKVIELWVAHLLSVEVTVEAVVELQDAPFTWYVGLDADGTAIGDALWNGRDLDDAARRRVVALYRLQFANADEVDPRLRGEPVYLIAAMTSDKVLRLKPQNLITGLPIRRMESVS
jgi:Family of unknown function (DUF6352)